MASTNRIVTTSFRAVRSAPWARVSSSSLAGPVQRRPTLRSDPSTPESLPALAPANVRFKSKRSMAANVDEPYVESQDTPVLKTRGKGRNATSAGPKGAKSKRGNKERDVTDNSDSYRTSTGNDELPGEKFSSEAMIESMTRAVERCKQTVSQMVGMQGRADPALLDSVQVGMPGSDNEKYPLRDFATVGTRDGALVVTLYDPDMLKHIERAIYLADLGLVPQQMGSGDEAVLRIPVPRPTAESRQKLLSDINRICENARVSVRASRQQSQKQIKSDLNRKVISQDDSYKENKKVDDETKKWSKDVEDFYNSIKKRVESES